MNDETRAFLRWLLDQPPSFQRTRCCSFSVGSHYNLDGTVGGDLEPPHEPDIDPDSGVVILDCRSLRSTVDDLLRELAPVA